MDQPDQKKQDGRRLGQRWCPASQRWAQVGGVLYSRWGKTRRKLGPMLAKYTDILMLIRLDGPKYRHTTILLKSPCWRKL